MSTTTHGVPGFGELGESTEAHELKRVRGIMGDEPPAPPSVPDIFRANGEREMALMVKAVMHEVTRELQQAVDGIRHDIVANTNMLKMMDVPLEQVAASHERASASFETLRADIFKGGIDKLERVLDTAGLTDAASKTELRLQALIDKLDRQITAAFTVNSENMVKILHLLERLQTRELRDTKKRMERGAKRAVRSGAKV
jgi:hypothetical protein